VNRDDGPQHAVSRRKKQEKELVSLGMDEYLKKKKKKKRKIKKIINFIYL